MEYEGIIMGIEKDNIKEKWKEYYISHRSDVLYLALSCVHSINLADDVTQDVFLKLHKTLLKGKEIGNIKGWLYKTTIRTCLDWKKSFWNNIFSKKVDLAVEIPSFNYGYFEMDNNFKKLNINLKKLPKKQKVAISLRFYKDMDIKEIASAMQISESSVKTHLKRGIKKLKKFMEVKDETQ